ncbi:hypothetical protein [Bacillus toyonensis]|nr:hypothetical protein [Bacillus toyonensis]
MTDDEFVKHTPETIEELTEALHGLKPNENKSINHDIIKDIVNDIKHIST